MTDFKISDVLRLKTDEPDRLRIVIRDPDPKADLKQAIREVLLSDEFMKAFAAAWMKTPLPIAIPCDDKDQERIKSLADCSFGEPTEATNDPT